MLTSGLFKIDMSTRENLLIVLEAMEDARDVFRKTSDREDEDEFLGMPFDKIGLMDPCSAGILKLFY